MSLTGVSTAACEHVAQYKLSPSAAAYEHILAKYVFPVHRSHFRARQRHLRCRGCKMYTSSVHVCAYCAHFACYARGHIHQHLLDAKHPLAFDLIHGTLYCVECGDYQYDTDLDAILLRYKLRQSRVLGLTSVRDNLHQDLQEKGHHPIVITDETTIGLRGLTNMGNTCFLNCVLQALVHTPAWRDFFLAPRHACETAESSAQCMVCEFLRLQQAFFSCLDTPLVPTRMLKLVFEARDFFGHGQHDAHELLIIILNTLHNHFLTYDGVQFTDKELCPCLVDTVFSGELQSDVQCLNCYAVSSKVDPFYDISLDIAAVSAAAAVAAAAGMIVLPELLHSEEAPQSLSCCLSRFTAPEKMTQGLYRCMNCDSYQNTTKQLTFKKLPVVLCFHLKRFEQTHLTGRKISTFVSFPEQLDMSEFMCGYGGNSGSAAPTGGDSGGGSVASDTEVGSNSSQMGNGGGSASRDGTPPASAQLYSLYCVVNHIGAQLDGGHYTCFVRHSEDAWYRCDDVLVEPTDLHEVLQSEAYLLFYHRKLYHPELL